MHGAIESRDIRGYICGSNMRNSQTHLDCSVVVPSIAGQTRGGSDSEVKLKSQVLAPDAPCARAKPDRPGSRG